MKRDNSTHEQGGAKTEEDLINYKGIYFGDDNAKFQDEATGAHFRYHDICQRLEVAKKYRKEIDLKLNIDIQKTSPSRSSSCNISDKDLDENQQVTAQVIKIPKKIKSKAPLVTKHEETQPDIKSFLKSTVRKS